MKLLIDIGNTNTSIGVLNKKSIKKSYFIYTSKRGVQPTSLKRLLGKFLKDIDEVILVSVVPEFLKIVKKSLKKVLPGASIKVVGKEIKVPIKVKYKKPKEVGQDRLVTSFAARELYGKPVLVIDFGTAVTFDFVNKKGEYEGGLIFPGIRLGLESLHKKTALLPRIEIKKTKGIIGKDTSSSMNKGIVLGYSAMCEGIISLFRKEYGSRLKVVATGGNAALIAKYTPHIKEIKPNLIFTGLSFLQ